MASPTQAAPGYSVWQIPGERVVVHIRLVLIDRLEAEVKRGFRSLPKRGAEIGGLLIGTIDNGSPAIVLIEDFEPIPCCYQFGPSYEFTEDDAGAFETAWERQQPNLSPSAYAVGYFRSHTRDGLSLDAKDIVILDHCFANPAHVALLVKPHATQASAAGLFVREEGAFPRSTSLEIPFGQPERLSEEAALPPPPPQEEPEQAPFELAPAFTPEPAAPQPIAAPPPAFIGRAQPRTGWLWIPLSFISMLMGVVIGFQAAVTMETRVTASTGDEFSLALSVAQSGDNLSLRWDRQTAAIRSARKGILEIEEGGYTKSVDLDGPQLQSGSLIYRNSTNAVRFRLTVYPNARAGVTETLSWKR